MKLTRRTLLGGTGVLAGLGWPARAAAQEEEGRRALLVVLPLVRADYVNGFDGDSGTDTPNIDELTGRSLRFDRVIPECMPALPVRRLPPGTPPSHRSTAPLEWLAGWLASQPARQRWCAIRSARRAWTPAGTAPRTPAKPAPIQR